MKVLINGSLIGDWLSRPLSDANGVAEDGRDAMIG